VLAVPSLKFATLKPLASVAASLGKAGALSLSAALLLTACGGGGGGGGGDSPSASADQAEMARLRTVSSYIPVSNAVAQQPVTTPACDRVPALPAVPTSVVSVRDHGAVPNDDQDDTAAIQAAIKAAKSGQWVVFPAGRYIHSKSLQVTTPGVTLWGQGATLHATNAGDQAILLKADGTRVYGFTLTAVTEGRRSEAWTSRISAYGPEASVGYIRGVVIQGNRILALEPAAGTPLSNGASAAGILMVSVRDFTVADNVVERSLADGIHVTGASQNGRILGNQVKETGDDMIAVVSYLDKGWRSKIALSPGWLTTARATSRVKDVLISGNQVSGQYWGRGISVVGGEGITIKANDVSRSAMGAGIMVAREEVYGTHGVSNVWVEGNRVTKIQTDAPSYVPTGPNFVDLTARLAVNGGRTGHAGIEIHNTSTASDYNNPVYAPAIGLADVMVKGNTVDDVGRNAIRVGADSPGSSISGVVLLNNKMSNARSGALAAIYNTGAPVIVQCDGNTYADAPSSLVSCISPQSSTLLTGAMLSCSAF
jgi:hypothetical protein